MNTADLEHRLSLAPMMDHTDRHFRFIARQISRHIRLYTEMLTDRAVLHGNREQLLGFDVEEHPVALQLAGREPGLLAEAARIGEAAGYDEINLNVGCPSGRVQEGGFGARLMLEPPRVAEIARAVRAAVDIPLTVKHRIGVDDHDTYNELERFVETVAGSGVRIFQVHARKAWSSELSPKENREKPPLRHADVYRLQTTHPELLIVLNGGVHDLKGAEEHLVRVRGVMIGRAAYGNPWMLAEADARIFADPRRPTRREVLIHLLPYVENHLSTGGRLYTITRHLLSLFKGQPGGRRWRQELSRTTTSRQAGLEALEAAIKAVPDEVLDARGRPAPA